MSSRLTPWAPCRLTAYALKLHAARPWGAALLFVRDRLVERVGHEEVAEVAAELRRVASALTAAAIECYCRGHFAALGVASKAELPHTWLCALLITPLLRAAGR